MKITNVFGIKMDLDLEALKESGDIEECCACAGLSAYSYDLVNLDPEKVLFKSKGEQKSMIAHIGASSGFEWECGHCRANNVPVDSPLLHPCYTHSED